jgi:HEAT repeat protein
MQFSSDPIGSARTPAVSLCQRALTGDDSAAIELLTRLAAGDRQLESYVSSSQDAQAARVREAVVAYLARGRWLGRALPLPPGSHAGQMGRHLRELIAQAAQTGSASAWGRTLLALLGDPDAVVRETAIHLLECSRTPEVVFALLEALGDRDERVRWAAGIELAKTGRLGAEGVLRHIVMHEVTPEARHVMAYVLRRTADEALRQQAATVVEALDSTEYRVAAPLAANRVLASQGGSASEHT